MTDEPRVLLVDSEPNLDDTLGGRMEQHGYCVLHTSGAEVVATLLRFCPSLVVLTAMGSERDGLVNLRQIRSCSAAPVIMLGGVGGETVTVEALSAGADDYLTHPFSPRELLARIDSRLRRATQPMALSSDALVVDADLTIDFARNRIVVRGVEKALTATEHRLLYHLVSRAGRLLPFETLLTRVWGPEYREEVHYVRLYVSYLRAKIEPDPSRPRYILTEKGLGYRFADLRDVLGRIDYGTGSRSLEPAQY